MARSNRSRARAASKDAAPLFIRAVKTELDNYFEDGSELDPEDVLEAIANLYCDLTEDAPGIYPVADWPEADEDGATVIDADLLDE